MSAVDLGEVVQRTVLFRNSSGVATDADSSPTYTVILPDGSVGTSPAVAHGATGEYFVLYPTTVPGMHIDRWTGLVGGVSVIYGPDSFRVRAATPEIGRASCRERVSSPV